MSDDECALPWTRERGAMLELDLDENEALDHREECENRHKAWEETINVTLLLHLQDPTFFGAGSKEARSLARLPPPGVSLERWAKQLRKTGHLK